MTPYNYVIQSSGFLSDNFSLQGACYIPMKSVVIDKNSSILPNIGDFVPKNSVIANGDTEQRLSFNGLFFNAVNRENETELIFYDYDNVLVNVPCNFKDYLNFINCSESEREIICLDNKHTKFSFERAYYLGGEYYNLELKVTSISPELINDKILNVCFYYNIIICDVIVPQGSLVFENNSYFINVYDDDYAVFKLPVDVLNQNNFLASVKIKNSQYKNLKIVYDIVKTTQEQINIYYKSVLQ